MNPGDVCVQVYRGPRSGEPRRIRKVKILELLPDGRTALVQAVHGLRGFRYEVELENLVPSSGAV